MPRKHLFGPVASRRLGRSLGVDLIPAKTCPFDCIYCEVGRTTNHTGRRRSYIPPGEILGELDAWFAAGGKADYITFTGSGEPTLSADLGYLINEARRRYKVPVAVITNGALLADESVRRELMAADLVMPSLDSARQGSFEAVNRPCCDMKASDMLDGLAEFAGAYEGHLWLEILLVAGVNDSDEDVDALCDAVARVRPERVQLNTVIRPPAVISAKPVAPKRLEEIAARLSRIAPTEIIAPASLRSAAASGMPPERAVLETLERRPCTLEDLAAGLSLPVDEVRAVVDTLVRGGRIEVVEYGSGTFYQSAAKTEKG